MRGPEFGVMMEQVKKIVVLRLGAMGDILFATPALRALKAKYPGCHITYIALGKWRFVLQHNPNVDRFFGLKYCHPRAVASLAHEEFDLLINLHETEDAARVCQSLKAKERRGDQWRDGKLVHDENSRYLQPNESIRGMILEGITFPALHCRIAGVSPTDLHYDLFPSWPHRWRAAWFWRRHRLMDAIALHLDSRGAPSKQWNPESVRSVARLMPSQQFLILGYRKDRALTRPLEALPNITVNYDDVLTQAELIRRCRLFVGIDSGPRQVASAMRVPVLCLVGPRPSETLERFDNEFYLQTSCPKSPCFEATCPDKRDCMAQIPPQAIVAEINRIMSCLSSLPK